jgi:TatD DNase family protein
MQFIDSHAHLNDPAFDKDRYTLISTLLPQAGLEACIEIGCSPDEWQPAIDLTHKYPGMIYPVLGVHPEYAPLLQASHWPELEKLLSHAVAVGEIGLDYTCLEVAEKELQQTVFVKMLALAKQTNKPIVLHVRREGEDYSAYDDCFATLKQHWRPSTSTGHPGVLHCFCARYEEAVRALDNGLLLGINGCFTYKKNEYIREAVKKAGLDKIILETDCPYLSPQGKRGLRNDPSNIPLLAQFVADYLDVPVEEVAQTTTYNTKKLYGLP